MSPPPRHPSLTLVSSLIDRPSDRKKYLGPALQGFVRASLDYGLHVVDAEMEVPVEKPSHLDWFRALADDHYGVLAAVAGILSPPPGKVSWVASTLGVIFFFSPPSQPPTASGGCASSC